MSTGLFFIYIKNDVLNNIFHVVVCSENYFIKGVGSLAKYNNSDVQYKGACTCSNALQDFAGKMLSF